eukprot:4774475-Pleurochrysis_carterae.AAC.1
MLNRHSTAGHEKSAYKCVDASQTSPITAERAASIEPLCFSRYARRAMGEEADMVRSVGRVGKLARLFTPMGKARYVR